MKKDVSVRNFLSNNTKPGMNGRNAAILLILGIPISAIFTFVRLLLLGAFTDMYITIEWKNLFLSSAVIVYVIIFVIILLAHASYNKSKDKILHGSFEYWYTTCEDAFEDGAKQVVITEDNESFKFPAEDIDIAVGDSLLLMQFTGERKVHAYRLKANGVEYNIVPTPTEEKLERREEKKNEEQICS